MEAIKTNIINGNWLATEYIDNDKKITVMIPPKYGGTSEDPNIDWDMKACQSMAQKIINLKRRHQNDN